MKKEPKHKKNSYNNIFYRKKMFYKKKQAY